MTATLFIRPYAHQPQRGDYLLLDKENRIEKEEQDILLEDIETLATQHPVILIIPGTDILMTSVSLPNLSPRKRHQAIPFALEEHLCEDIETLHFVVDDHPQGNEWPVALINKSLLQQWIAPWQNKGVELVAAIADFLGLPFDGNQWHIAIANTGTLIRINQTKGFAIDTPNLPLFLKTALAEQLTYLPEKLVIYPLTENIPLNSDDLTALGIPVHFEQPTTLLSLIATHKTTSTLNLLQHEFMQHKKSSANKKSVRIIGVLGVIFILCFITSQLITYRMLHQKNQVLTQQIETLYHQVFPQATHVVAPEARFKQLLNTLKTQQSTPGFLQLLTQTSTVFHTVPSLQLQALRFTEHHLIFTLEVDSFSALEALTKELQAQGLSVTQNSASSKNNHISATLLITGEKS